MIDIQPLGDRAVVARFRTEAEASGWVQAVAEAALPGVADVCLAYASAAIHADPDQIADWNEWVERLRQVQVDLASSTQTGRIRRIPVCYDGPDLSEVAHSIDATEAEVVALHSGQPYRVFAIGFQPGFPYAGYLPERLSGIPRRSSPRPRVPAGSVAIAGRQTGIYPRDSPGGWHLLGRTPRRILDMDANFWPIVPGDFLQFESISVAELEQIRACQKRLASDDWTD